MTSACISWMCQQCMTRGDIRHMINAPTVCHNCRGRFFNINDPDARYESPRRYVTKEKCPCGGAVDFTCRKGKNAGRMFLACKPCRYFDWIES